MKRRVQQEAGYAGALVGVENKGLGFKDTPDLLLSLPFGY